MNDLFKLLDLIKNPAEAEKALKPLREENERLERNHEVLKKAKEIDVLYERARKSNIESQEKIRKVSLEAKEIVDKATVEADTILTKAKNEASLARINASRLEEQAIKREKESIALKKDLTTQANKQTKVEKDQEAREKSLKEREEEVEKGLSILSQLKP